MIQPKQEYSIMIYQKTDFKRAALLAFHLAQAGQAVARMARIGGVWIIETREAN